jgi:hypothetical protein
MISFLLDDLNDFDGWNDSEWRPLPVPIRALLIAVSGSQDRHFIERFTDELKRNG